MTRTHYILLAAIAAIALFTGCESIKSVGIGGAVSKDGDVSGNVTITLAKKKGLAK